MSKNLDMWDCKMIDICKGEKYPQKDNFREVWAERCGIDIEDVSNRIVVFHMIEMIDKYQLASVSDMVGLMFRNEGGMIPLIPPENLNMEDLLFRFVIDTLRLKRVSDLPGYREWKEAEENQEEWRQANEESAV